MRPYDPHRRARPPRLWPWALLAAVVAFGVTYVLPLKGSWWLAIVGGFIGAGCGFLVVIGRWAIYRRMHPMRPCGPGCFLHLEVHARKQREVARWQ